MKEKRKKQSLKERVINKDWWKKELKDFGWTNLLIIIAIILLFSAFLTYKEVIKDPCNFCYVDDPYKIGGEGMTCKEYFDKPKINLNFSNNLEIKDYG